MYIIKHKKFPSTATKQTIRREVNIKKKQHTKKISWNLNASDNKSVSLCNVIVVVLTLPLFNCIYLYMYFCYVFLRFKSHLT